MTSQLLNLLDNAIEACVRLDSRADRWISLGLSAQADGICIACANAAPPEGQADTSKPDKWAHGFGLGQMRHIVRRYGGTMETSRLEESFSVLLTLKEEGTP